ncbi:MAG: hypothetical protein R3E77_05995 [Steroidobacteraceae bacterium]
MALHTLGVLGQTAAALTYVVITIIYSRSDSVAVAGKIAVSVGMSAAVFAVSHWALQANIMVKPETKAFCTEYFVLRFGFLCIACVSCLVALQWLDIAWSIALAVALMRCADGVIDLVFGFDVVVFGVSAAWKKYAFAHVAKLLAIGIVGAITHFYAADYLGASLATSAFVCVVGAIYLSRGYVRPKTITQVSISRIRTLLNSARWLALASICSALIVSLPRILAAEMYSGTELGVIGVALTVVGTFGLIFYTSWTRFARMLSATRTRASTVRSLAIEIFAWALVLAVLALGVLPEATAYIFKIDSAEQIVEIRSTILAGVIFFSGMAFVNLYKVTTARWMEAVTYLIAALCITVLSYCPGPLRNMPSLLVLGGILMFGISIPALKMALLRVPDNLQRDCQS